MALIDLQKRIQVLEDIEEIKKMHRQYVFWLATHEHWEDMVTCFTEDAIVDIRIYGPKFGKAEITKLFRNIISEARVMPDSPRAGHFLMQPVIDVNEDRAIGHWLLDRMFDDVTTPGGPTLKMMRGRYDCEYKKENGRWKFRYLKWTVPWPVPPGATS
jgi:hypothetical protein